MINKVKKNKIIILITFILMTLFLLLIFNFKNIFLSETTKKVKFSLNDKKLINQEIEIKDNEIIMPHLKELDTDVELGQTFDGYDINNDGKADYMPGDTMKVTPNFMSLDVDLIISDDDIPFKAWLYDDNTFIKGTELKNNIDTISTPWDYLSQMRYLVIEPMFTESVGGTIEINLPVGMQWYDGDSDVNTTTFTPVGGDITDVTFTKLSGLSGTGGQGAGIYSNPRTGTITYTYSPLATKEDPIIIPVTFDQFIWDGKSGDESNITNDFDAIKVTMTEKDNTYSKSLKEISFSKTVDRYLHIGYVPSEYGLDMEYSSYHAYPVANGYYKEFKITFELPSNGENYAQYIKEDPINNIDDPYEVDTSDPTKVIYIFKDVIIDSNPHIGQILYFDSSKFSIGQTVRTNFTLEGTTYGGTTVTSKTTKVSTIIDNVNIIAGGRSRSVSDNNADKLESLLGITLISNTGMLDSGKIKLQYNFNSKQEINSNQQADIAVRYLRLIQIRNKNFDVNYTLTDYNNNEVGTGTINVTASDSNTDGKVLSIYEIVNDYNTKNANTENFEKIDPEEVMIKTLDYYIDSVPAKEKLFRWTAEGYILSSGNYYGKILTKQNGYTSFTATEYDIDGNVKKTVPLTVNSFITQGKGNSLSVSGDYTNTKTSYQAGIDIDFKLKLYMHEYPYRESQISVHPNIYAVLPNGVELSDSTYGTRNNKKYTPTITKKRLTDALTLYTVKFDLGEDFMGGPFTSNEQLNSAGASGTFLANLKFKTDPTLNYTPLNLRNIIYVGEDGAHSTQIGPNNTIEPYDFDENGKLDKWVTMVDYYNVIFSVNPNNNQLKFSNEISINEKSFTSIEESKIISETDGEFSKGIASFRLNIENNSDGLVAGEDFYHYIPVIKKDVTYPDGVNSSNAAVDFKLTNEPVIYADNSNIYKYLYTTETSLADADGNLKESVEFKTIDEIDNIEDVTMIKITGNKNSLLMPYTKDIIELNLNYEVVNNDTYNSGKTISFSTYGWQKYLEGGLVNTENILSSTDGVKIITRYLTEYNKTISNTLEFELPEYFEDKDIYILDVLEYNLNLVDKESIISNKDSLDITTTDNNFNIIASLNEKTYDLSDFNTAVLLDKINKDTSNKIKFDLTTYNNILDSTSSKYIEIYLGDDLGIKYKLILNISRESTYKDIVNDSIVSGSYYSVLLGNNTNITLTSNSSYTAQFNVNYNESDTNLRLTSNFKKDTIIKMIDITNLSKIEGNYDFEPEYYYYKVTEDKTDILLTEFKNNKNDDNYTYSDSTLNKYIFIVENNTLVNGNYTIGINKTVGGSAVNEGTLNYTITDNRSFNITDNSNTFEIKNNQMNISLDITSSVNGTDTKYSNNLFGLKINFDTVIPQGSYIEMNDKVYLVEDYDYVLNNDNYFLIPLGNINSTKHIEYIFHAGTQDYTGTNITHSIVLLDEPKGNTFANLNNNTLITDFKDPALLLNLEKQLLSRDELSNLNLNLKYIDYDNTTNFSAKVYILEKHNDYYLKSENLINSIEVNNTTHTPYKDQVVFDLDDNIEDINIKLNLNKELYKVDGTYRIVLETNHLGLKNINDVINFIVTE